MRKFQLKIIGAKINGKKHKLKSINKKLIKYNNLKVTKKHSLKSILDLQAIHILNHCKAYHSSFDNFNKIDPKLINYRPCPSLIDTMIDLIESKDPKYYISMRIIKHYLVLQLKSKNTDRSRTMIFEDGGGYGESSYYSEKNQNDEKTIDSKEKTKNTVLPKIRSRIKRKSKTKG